MVAARRGTASTTALLLLLLLAVSVSSSSLHRGQEQDRSALLQLKNAVPSAELLRRWSPESGGADHCSWPGLTCDARSRVIALVVPSTFPRSRPGRELAGELPPAVGLLTELKELSFPSRGLRGEIPAEIWRMEKLEVVSLAGNSLRGALPATFPPRLRVLNLASNLFHGEIPTSLSNCKDLQRLDLSGNRLTGPVPGVLGGLPMLKRLDLSRNLLSGSIPSGLGNCTQLRSLRLLSNLLDGSIPPEIGSLRKLRVLDVSRNRLSGPVPLELGNCSDLSVFVLSSQFNAVNLPEFNLFKGGIPESVTALPKLRVLWAPKAGLEGNVPSNWGRCHSLRMVNLAQNLLSGVIPRGLGQCSNLKFLNLSSNRLSGPLGNDLYPHCMAVFDVSGNELSGSIPAFANKGCSSQLMLDDMQSDYSSLFMSEAVAELSLGYCDSGECSVVYHNFAKNNFGGHLTSLPFSADRFGNKTLYAFLVDHNNFTGSLDAILLEQCGNLNGLIVSFRDNEISGGLTAEISTKSRAIRVLDLAGNQISGVMPANIGLLVALVNMDISRNLLEGQIPASFKDPKSFNIPSSLVTLKDLTALLLNNNELSGNISNLNQLQTSLLLVEVFVSGLPRYTLYLKFEHRFQEWGLEKGWGDTAERCKEASVVGLETLGDSPVMGITNWCKTSSYCRMILRGGEHLLVVDCKNGNWIAGRADFLPREPVSFILLEDLTLSVCYHTRELSKPWETTCPVSQTVGHISSCLAPIHVKNLFGKELKQLANEVRSEISFSMSRKCQPCSTGQSVVELTIAIHYVYNVMVDALEKHHTRLFP